VVDSLSAPSYAPGAAPRLASGRSRGPPFRLKTLRPVYRVATRRWLHVKFLSTDERNALAQQALVWLGLTVLLLWGVVGLVTSPLY
jgi:hypothetical protein